MARYSAAGRSAGAGSTTLPVFSHYATAAVSPRIREIGVYNTAAVAVALKLAYLTSTGTQGAALTEVLYDPSAGANVTTGFQTHTAGPTIATGSIRAVVLGAAVGSGTIWTFGDTGLVVPLGTANGIGIVVATGTGQILDFYYDFDE